MSDLVLWIAAEAERPKRASVAQQGGLGPSEEELREIKPHTFHGEKSSAREDAVRLRSGQAKGHEDCAEAINTENTGEHEEVQELYPPDSFSEEEERARRTLPSSGVTSRWVPAGRRWRRGALRPEGRSRRK